MRVHEENNLCTTLITAILFSSVIGTESVNAQFLGDVYINPDGSITGTNKIQCNENIYTLTGNISGGIQIQKSHIVLDGAGYVVEGNGEGIGIDLSNGVGQDPSRPTISNVTVKNLRIMDCYFGVETNGGGNHTFYGNYISSSCVGISLTGCSYNKISYCTVIGQDAIGMYYQSNYNTITENNIVGYLQVWLSGNETNDSNYWGNYSSHGDNHPLMLPVAIPAFPDTKSPALSVVSPENKIYNSSSVSLAFTVDEPIVWAGYSLDGRENVTVAGNTTIAGLPNGLHSLVVFANDTFENMGASETVSFTVAFLEPFPITLAIGSVIAVAAVGLGLFVYFNKRLKGK